MKTAKELRTIIAQDNYSFWNKQLRATIECAMRTGEMECTYNTEEKLKLSNEDIAELKELEKDLKDAGYNVLSWFTNSTWYVGYRIYHIWISWRLGDRFYNLNEYLAGKLFMGITNLKEAIEDHSMFTQYTEAELESIAYDLWDYPMYNLFVDESNKLRDDIEIGKYFPNAVMLYNEFVTDWNNNFPEEKRIYLCPYDNIFTHCTLNCAKCAYSK